MSEDGYHCKLCGWYTHKSNSHYERGWHKIGLCPSCIREGNPRKRRRRRKTD